MTRSQSLQRLLSPKSIAVFGGDSAAEVIRQCRAVGFDGELWAVNPNRSELEGIACVASVADLPGVPDASFIAAPPESTLGIIADLSARGAPGAICFAAGFAETGAEEGAALQQRLRDAAGDMAVLGPNCHGYVNYLDGVALWPDQHGGQRVESGAALISQSGNIAINLTMQQRQIDFSYVISVGNSVVLGLHDYIDALLADSRVRVIALHIEGIVDIAAFSEAAIRALRKGVPIVALKTGRSSRGAEIALSHTASLAGSDKLYSALFQRLGIARCDTLGQFLETIKFLSIVGPLPEATVASMSCSGGDASLVADFGEHLQLDFPKLSDESAENLKTLLGPNVNVSNPLDYHLYIWANYEQLRQCFHEVLSNQFGCTLLILDYPPGDGDEAANWEISERALITAIADTGGRAVVVSSLPETLPDYVRERLKASGIAPMQGIEDCLFAVKAAALIGMAENNVDKTLAVMRMNRAANGLSPSSACRFRKARPARPQKRSLPQTRLAIRLSSKRYRVSWRTRPKWAPSLSISAMKRRYKRRLNECTGRISSSSSRWLSPSSANSSSVSPGTLLLVLRSRSELVAFWSNW